MNTDHPLLEIRGLSFDDVQELSVDHLIAVVRTQDGFCARSGRDGDEVQVTLEIGDDIRTVRRMVEAAFVASAVAYARGGRDRDTQLLQFIGCTAAAQDCKVRDTEDDDDARDIPF